MRKKGELGELGESRNQLKRGKSGKTGKKEGGELAIALDGGKGVLK